MVYLLKLLLFVCFCLCFFLCWVCVCLYMCSSIPTLYLVCCWFFYAFAFFPFSSLVFLAKFAQVSCHLFFFSFIQSSPFFPISHSCLFVCFFLAFSLCFYMSIWMSRMGHFLVLGLYSRYRSVEHSHILLQCGWLQWRICYNHKQNDNTCSCYSDCNILRFKRTISPTINTNRRAIITRTHIEHKQQ